MDTALKVLFVVMSCVGGYLVLLLMGFFADLSGYIPDVVSAEQARDFYFYLFGIGVFLLILCGVASFGYIFIDRPWKKWLLFAPLYVPFIYSIAVMIAFYIGAPSALDISAFSATGE